MTNRHRADNSAQDIIEILDPNLRLGFAQMPRPVLRAAALSRNAKTLYALLLDYAWQDGSCFPGQARLATDLDISVDTLKRDLDELRRYGLLNWKQRGMNQTNIYYILPLNECPHLNLNHKINKPELESADLPHPESADVRNPDSANVRVPESADSRTQDSANARKQESARLRSKKDAASPDSEHQTQTTTRRSRAAHATQPSVVVVVQQPVAEQPNPLIGKLVAEGVTASTATRLCAGYPGERITQQLEALAYLRRTRPGEVKDPAAWLRTAIEQDWAAPRGFKSAAQREAEQAARIAAYAEQASMHDLFSIAPSPALPMPTPPSPPASDTWTAVLARLRPYLSSDKLALLERARLLPYLPGQRVARLVVASLFERSQLQPLHLHHLELALSDVLGESVAVEVVLGLVSSSHCLIAIQLTSM